MSRQRGRARSGWPRRWRKSAPNAVLRRHNKSGIAWPTPGHAANIRQHSEIRRTLRLSSPIWHLTVSPSYANIAGGAWDTGWDTMARLTEKLTADRVARVKQRGYYGDGGGLWLRVGPTGAKSWVFRYRADGKQREIGLGPVRLVNLAEARAKAREHEKALLAKRHGEGGYDPLDKRGADRIAVQLEAAKAMSFRECGDQYIEAHRAGWHSLRHLQQWQRSLRDYVYPVFGALPVQVIDTALVRK